MAKATEVFHQLDQGLRHHEGDYYPLADALALQLRLAHQLEAILNSAEAEIGVADYLLGEYQQLDRPRPHSSTGEVLFVTHSDGTQLALKLLLKLDAEQNFLANPDQTYAFDHPAVRLMTATGESLMGKAANRHQQLYHGVAGVRRVAQTIELVQFSVEDVLTGQMEPVIVMRQMEASLADVLLDTVDAEPATMASQPNREQMARWTQQVMKQVFDASVPLPEDLAAEIGAPAEVENLLTGKTIGWMTSRVTDPEVIKHPLLWQAIRHSQVTQAAFRQFFALPETQANLAERAKPYVGEGEQQRLAQTFSPGDTKFGNVMLAREASGDQIAGLFDPQWLVLRPNAIGNERHMFAPWPFADLMQIAAFTSTQPFAYGFPDLGELVHQEVRDYYGEVNWSTWHDAYLSMLTAYKLLVDVAYGIDPYIEKVTHGQPIPRQLRWILEAHPQKAVELASTALHTYQQNR